MFQVKLRSTKIIVKALTSIRCSAIGLLSLLARTNVFLEVLNQAWGNPPLIFGPTGLSVCRKSGFSKGLGAVFSGLDEPQKKQIPIIYHLIYDDLTKHAKAYRSLSLLLRRPPGREAYPGDIFYIHSRLLERSAKLDQKYGGGSITALPIVETQQGRISSYIPTNLISITDGQIYLDTGLFNKGIRPAVDVGRSVSRIGGKAQIKAMKLVAERLKIDYSHFSEVEVFTKFGAHVEEETAKLLRRGERMREIMKQPRFHPFSAEEEFLSLLVLETGVLDELKLNAVNETSAKITAEIIKAFPEIISRINKDGEIGQEEMDKLREFILEQKQI